MGCDTKGYIKGMNLQDLMKVVSVVATELHVEKEERKFHKVGDFCVSPYNSTFDHYFFNFFFGENAQYTNNWTIDETTAEARRMFFGSYAETEENEPYMDDYGRYAILSLGMWGSATEIITLFLLHAKSLGFDVYLQECDCGEEPVQL